jgi:hypothetical protein
VRKSSKYYGLDYFVQCSWPEKHHFETIAAFGWASVATDYAKEVLARQCVPGFRYRVVHQKNNEPTCVWRSYQDAKEKSTIATISA